MEEEIRYCVETVDNFYITSGFIVSEQKLVFSDGGEDVISVPVDEILHIVKEVISKKDVTEEELGKVLVSV